MLEYRDYILDILETLSSPEFAKVVFYSGFPREYLPNTPQAQQAITLIEFFEKRIDLKKLTDSIYRVAPELCSKYPSIASVHLSPLKNEDTEQISAIPQVVDSNSSIPARPSSFVGREKEIRKLTDWLMEGSSVLIQGDPRIGKTCLLRKCMAQLHKTGRNIKLLEGRSEAAASPAVLIKIITGETIENHPDHAANVLQTWATNQTSPPVLLFDDAHMFVTFPVRFFERLGGMLEHQKLVAVFASSHELTDLPLTLRHLPLGLLDAHAAGILAARSSQPALLLQWAGHHPHYLQLFCSYLSAKTQIGDPEIGEATRQLRQIWERLSSQEIDVLCAIYERHMVTNIYILSKLRLRGLLNADNSLFGEVMRAGLEEECSK